MGNEAQAEPATIGEAEKPWRGNEGMGGVMGSMGINDTLYNLAAEYGPCGFCGLAGEDLRLCDSGQRTWVQAKGRWFFWQLESCEEIGSRLKASHWEFVGEVRVCYGRRPMRPNWEWK